MDKISILVLAAGASSRMRGKDKLLMPVDNVPLLRRQVLRALQLECLVVVTMAPDRPARRAALSDLHVDLVEVADAGEGMAASIRAGIGALPDGITGAMILPADMPEIDAADMRMLVSEFIAHADRIIQATSDDGRPGHPVIFPKRLFSRLMALRGDQGARSVLRNEKVDLVALPAQHALVDLDTPEAWSAWEDDRQS